MAHRKRTLLPIGIHLGSDAVHMVQLEQTDTGVAVVSKASKQLAPLPAANPDDDPVAELTAGAPPGASNEARYEEAREFVHQKITKDGFRGSEAVISLPPEHLAIQHVRLPPIQPEELEGSLLGELQGKLPFSIGEAVIRHIVAGTVSENNETKQDVIVLAARRAVVESQVASVAKLGLQIVGVGVEPCAMCYPYTFAASHAPPAPEGPSALMIVYLGSRATHVAIVRGLEMTFVKGIELGTEHLVDAIANARRRRRSGPSGARRRAPPPRRRRWMRTTPSASTLSTSSTKLSRACATMRLWHGGRTSTA
jgi:Tfp pilus assembly PilM family ATPase